MSDTPNRPESEPQIDNLPSAPEDARPASKSEEESVKGGLNFPDYAKTPSPAGPIPIPYPNFSKF